MDHTIVHFEIPAKNIEKLSAFYIELFAWKFTKSMMPMEYWTIETVPVNQNGQLIRPGVNGGIYMKEQAEHVPVNYVGVESVDDSIAKIKKLGGKIVVPKMEVPNIGWTALATDPEGNFFGLFQSMPMPPQGPEGTRNR